MSATYVAIIMDGNGRWAEQRGVSVADGHDAGADTVKARLRDAVDLGIRELTLYSFSTENWSRPQDEVDALMSLFSARIIEETPELHEQGVRMRFIGRRSGVNPELIEQMEWAEAKTAGNDVITLFVAFNYGGRAEILDAAERYCGGGEEAFRALLYAPDMHDPELLDPHERRAAHLQLPAVAAGLQRAVLRRRRSGQTSRAPTSRPRSPTTRRVSAASAVADGLRPPRAGPRRDPGGRVRRLHHLRGRLDLRRGHRRARR